MTCGRNSLTLPPKDTTHGHRTKHHPHERLLRDRNLRSEIWQQRRHAVEVGPLDAGRVYLHHRPQVHPRAVRHAQELAASAAVRIRHIRPVPRRTAQGSAPRGSRAHRTQHPPARIHAPRVRGLPARRRRPRTAARGARCLRRRGADPLGQFTQRSCRRVDNRL